MGFASLSVISAASGGAPLPGMLRSAAVSQERLPYRGLASETLRALEEQLLVAAGLLVGRRRQNLRLEMGLGELACIGQRAPDAAGPRRGMLARRRHRSSSLVKSG